MTENAASTFEGLLSKFAAFRNLDPDRLRWLAERARPFHCTVGQELLRPDRMPEFCFCIVEGAVACFMTIPVCVDRSPWPMPIPEIWLVGLVWCAAPL